MDNLVSRKPAVSGNFYSDNSTYLNKELDNFLNLVPENKNTKNKIKALVVPHAGYYYSGQIAAWAYKNVSHQKINRVFLMGDSHSSYFDGIALSDCGYWETPLGKVLVDVSLVRKIKDEFYFSKINNSIHDSDHILEVQLPFLQKIIQSSFSIIPMSLGNFSREYYFLLADFLKRNIKEDDLLIISSDFSHYPSGGDAEKIDKKSMNIIIDKNFSLLDDYIYKIMNSNIINEETLMCSQNSIKTLMILADNLNWSGEVLKYSHSGEISGDYNRVVGYGAIIFTK